MKKLATVLLTAVMFLGPSASGAQIRGIVRRAVTQKPAYRREVPPKLLAEAKVSEDSAKAIAMAKVPNGKIQALVLEREKGKLIYSFAFMVPGKSGEEEVNVDAMDGSVIAVERETPAQEAREQAAEKSKTPPPKKKP